MTWLFWVLVAYAHGAAIFPFVFAASRLRIESRESGVRLTGIDPVPMAALGLVVGVVPALLSTAGTLVELFGGAVALVGWFGCRVRVDVTTARTEVVRTVGFFLPWSRRRYEKPPYAFTDGWGWGDFVDAVALCLVLDDAKRKKIELAWGGNGTPSCDDLATKINEAMTALSLPREERVGGRPYR